MKSKIKSKKPVDTSKMIVVENVQVDPENIKNHKQRIDTIFANKPEEYRLEQINKMIMHDILFSKAMDYLFTHYEFSIDPEEQQEYITAIVSEWKQRFTDFKEDEQSKELAKMAADKLIVQRLIFEDIQQTDNISVSDEELEKILLDYYRNTNQPIRNFKQDEKSYENARTSILHEKTIAHILSMFKFDLEKFNKEVTEFAKKNNLEQK